MKPVLRSVAFSIIALMTFAAERSINAAGQASPDWITNKDRTGACQISVDHVALSRFVRQVATDAVTVSELHRSDRRS
jgi:hypothetical protein